MKTPRTPVSVAGRLGLALLLSLVAVFATAGGASALPTAEFTFTPSTPALGQPVSFTFTGTCDHPPCTISWRWFQAGGSHLGTAMGSGPNITYTFPGAGTYSVVAEITNSGSTHGSATVTHSLTVQDTFEDFDRQVAVRRVARCGRQERQHRRLPDGVHDQRPGLLRVHGHRGHLRRPDRAHQGHRLRLDRRIADQARGPLLAPRRHPLVAGDGPDGRRAPDPGPADRHQEPRLDRHGGERRRVRRGCDAGRRPRLGDHLQQLGWACGTPTQVVDPCGAARPRAPARRSRSPGRP